MALLDPSIPLQQRGLLLQSPLETRMRAEALRNQEIRGRLMEAEAGDIQAERQMRLEQLRQQQADAAAERELFSDPNRFMRQSPAVNPSEMDPEGAQAGQAQFDPRLLQTALLQSRNPALVRKGVELATPQQRAPVVVGDALVDPVTGRAIFRNPKQADQWRVVGSLPNGQEVQENTVTGERKAIGGAGTSVTVGLQSPYAGVDAEGKPIVVQPANKPGAPAVLLRDPRTNEPIRPTPPVDPNRADNTKKTQQAQKVLTLLGEADKLIEKSTGSAIGRGVDYAAGVFGAATEGAKANAQLRVIQAGLMTNMPRMEGPQSDRDVQLYREAAGQIGDPNVPAGIKRAAYGTIKRLNQQYAGVKSGPPAVGDVVDGYGYKGGNPALPTSWEKK
jgi:hypothetical protein